MPIVLDASFALAWSVKDEQSDYADQMLDLALKDGAIVPAIWRWEIAKNMLAYERRKRITPGEAISNLSDLNDLPIEVELEPPSEALEQSMGLAREFNISVYEASYLELAMRKSLRFATQDARLAKVAAKLAIERPSVVDETIMEE